MHHNPTVTRQPLCSSTTPNRADGTPIVPDRTSEITEPPMDWGGEIVEKEDKRDAEGMATKEISSSMAKLRRGLLSRGDLGIHTAK